MEQVIFGGYYNSLHATNTEYNSVIGGRTWTSIESGVWGLVATSGKIKNLRVKLDGAPGAGKSYTFTLMLNGAPSALTLTIADTDTSAADTTHEVDVVGGDCISLRCVPTNSPTARKATWTTMFEGATAKESLILGGTTATASKTGAVYGQVMCARCNITATENEHRQVCPTSGKIKNLYVKLNIDPGTAPDAYRFTLRKNGASTDLTVTITADDTTGNDTVNEVTVAAGDVLTIMVEPVESPAAFVTPIWGMAFVADTDGESVILAGTDDDLNTADTEYLYLQGNDMDGWGASEFNNLGQSCTLKKLYVLLSAAPGDGKSYTFTLRKPGNGQADGNLTVTITGAATTTGNDVAHEDAIADDDYVDLKCVPAGTPDVADAYWGLVGYTAPAPELENKSANMAAKMVAAGLI